MTAKKSTKSTATSNVVNTKPVKDINRPKKASTAYILFSNDMRQQVKASHPEMKSNELMTELGRLWKLLPEDQKAAYNIRFEAEKARYAQEMSTYTPPAPVVVASTSSAKAKSDVKKPMNAYVFFCQDKRPQLMADNPSMKFGDLTKVLAEQWKSMSEQDKQPYLKAAEAQKAEYHRQITTPVVVTTTAPAPAPAPVVAPAGAAPKKASSSKKEKPTSTVAAPKPKKTKQAQAVVIQEEEELDDEE